MSEINLEYTQLINQFKTEINDISSKAINEFYNQVAIFNETEKITLNTINHFEDKVNSILINAQNDLNLKQKEFYNSIDSMSISVSENIEEIKDIIEQKKQEALVQLNQSENSAIVRLEEIYDIGVSTILSAEKTSLNNLGILTEELIEKLKKTAENVDLQIKDKLKQAIKQIEEFSNQLKEEIKKTEIQIQENIKEEAKRLLAEIRLELDSIIVEMKNFSAILKKELTEHKDLMLQEIRQDKDKFFIEMDREQNRILEVLRLKEYEISINLNKKEQAIIANIAMVVNGYDRDLEELKQGKIKEFIESIKLIADKTINDMIENADMIFKSKIKDIMEEVKNIILVDTQEEVRKLLNNFSEQRYELVLHAGETEINLPKSEYTVTNRLKLYLDGTLQVREKHYNVNSELRKIILTRSFPDDLDVIVTEDFPNQDVQTQFETSMSELINTTNNCKEELKNLTTNSKNEVTETKDQFKQEITDTKNTSIDEINQSASSIIENITNVANSELDNQKQALDAYVNKYKEGSFTAVLEANQGLIIIDKKILKINNSVKVYCDGILQTPSKHYTINSDNNSITILTPFAYPIDFLVLQNLPVSDYYIREATYEEIESLFK